MMILIVDDELPIREWMKFTVEKIQDESLCVLTASNGEEALSLIKQHDIRLVFTDIKMPVMDGISLLENIKNHDKGIFVAMLTSYADFTYAREAFSLQADEYVLKTEISSHTILEILDKYYAKYTRPSMNSQSLKLQIKRAAIFKNIISGNFPETVDMCQQLFDAGILLKDEYLLAVSVRTDYTKDMPDFEDDMKLLKGTSLSNGCCFTLDKHTLIVIANVKNDSIAISNVESCLWWGFIDRIERLFENCKIGISDICKGILSLPECIRQSLIALDSTFYTDNRIYRFSMCKVPADEAWGEFYKALDNVQAGIDHFDIPEIRQRIDNLLDAVERQQFTDIGLIKRSCIGLLDKCRHVFNDLDTAIAGDKYENLNDIYSLKDFKREYNRLLDGFRNDLTRESTNEYVRKAKDYVRKNYKREISNTEVARDLNINSEYFCRLFKNETGVTFNTYLTQYKLNKAEELIKTTSLSVYEIANQTGYENVNYFSRLYKKIKGENPKDARRHCRL